MNFGGKIKVNEKLFQYIASISGLEVSRLEQIFRFLLVGSFLNISLLLIVILLHQSGVNYDLALLITNVIGLLLNYIMNRKFVFKSDGNVLRTMLFYMLTYASVYFLQLFIYRVIFSFDMMHEYFAIILTVMFSAIYAYILLEKVVFSKKVDLK